MCQPRSTTCAPVTPAARSSSRCERSASPLAFDPSEPPPRLPVLVGEEQCGERFERGHELVALAALEALVGDRGEVVGQRLDALLDGASRIAQPTVLADQAAVAHPVDHGGDLRGGEVVDATE